MRVVSWLRAHPVWADRLLAFGLATIVIGAAIGAPTVITESSSGFVQPANGAGWFIIPLPAICVAFRRTRPTLALLLGGVAILLVLSANLPNFFLEAGVLLYSAVAHGGKRGLRVAATVGTIISTLTLLSWIGGDAPFFAVPVVPLVFGTTISLGLHSVSRAERIVEAEERAKLAELHRRTDAQLIVDQERGRIARELHDVVAHGLSMIAVQAGGAQRVLTTNPDAAAEALGHIEVAARDALTEMRQVLGVLRSDDGTDRRPTPGLARLEELVVNVQESGLDVELDVAGDLTGLPTTIDTGAYRIVQEALTNVMKHGGPSATASVTVARSDHQLTIDVIDTGRGAASIPATAEGGGHGLVGMRERATVTGGTVLAGPRQGGGYRVMVTMPIESRAALGATP